MSVVDDLQALRWTENLVMALLDEQRRMEKIKEGCHSVKKGRYLEERLGDIQKKLQIEINTYIGLREEVLDVLQKVDDMRIRCVLELRYVNYLSWQEIAKRMGFSRRHVLRMNEMGLKKIAMLKKN